MIKSDVYRFVSYRNSIHEDYKNNPDMEIRKEDYGELEKEFTCLEKHERPWNFDVIESSFEMGYAIIKQSAQATKNLIELSQEFGMVPYVKYRPYISFCNENGFPCTLCSLYCETWGNCKYAKV